MDRRRSDSPGATAAPPRRRRRVTSTPSRPSTSSPTRSRPRTRSPGSPLLRHHVPRMPAGAAARQGPRSRVVKLEGNRSRRSTRAALLAGPGRLQDSTIRPTHRSMAAVRAVSGKSSPGRTRSAAAGEVKEARARDRLRDRARERIVRRARGHLDETARRSPRDL